MTPSRSELTAAVVQLNSQEDVRANLARAERLVREAAMQGATLVVLPENFAFMGEEEEKRAIAEDVTGARGPIVQWLCSLAKELSIHIVGGGMPERSQEPSRPYNSSVLVDDAGTVRSVYRKLHLFDVDLPGGPSYRESAACSPGDQPVVSDVCGHRLGMTICYDVRFPELYRKLALENATLITVPAAFTLMTGKDHWHVLLRARAIENQVFVLAAAQHGKHPKGRQTYGKSLIVDPWGDVLAQSGEGEGMAVARCSFDYLASVRSALPCMQHRRML